MRVHDTAQPHTAIAPTYSERRLTRRASARFFGGLVFALVLLTAYSRYRALALAAAALALLAGIYFAWMTYRRDPGSKTAELARP